MSLALAFSCFSRIPVPQVSWSEGNMRFLMAAFPLVGCAVGLIEWLWLQLCGAVGLGTFLTACGIVLIPLGATGAIHLDGFCDVVDALSSCAEPARKREILKDPHVGAFAVIGVASYLILAVGIASELRLTTPAGALLCLGFVLSRLCSSLCTLLVPRSSEEGMLASFQISAEKRPALAIVVVMALLCVAGIVAVAPLPGLALVLCAAVVSCAVMLMARKEFGGMSGDVAGFLVQTLELAFLVVLVVMQKVMML